MLTVKVRIYLFYVAAVFFVAVGLWMIGAGLFGGGGFTALIVGGLMFATGVVDYAMGSYLQKLYLNPRPVPAPQAEDPQPDSAVQTGQSLPAERTPASQPSRSGNDGAGSAGGSAG